MCMFCKCDTVTPSLTTHVVNYNGAIIVIKNVPCEECEQCGEKFYTDDVECCKTDDAGNCCFGLFKSCLNKEIVKLVNALRMGCWRAFCVKAKF